MSEKTQIVVIIVTLCIATGLYGLFLVLESHAERIEETRAQIQELRHEVCQVAADQAVRQAPEKGIYPGRARYDAYAQCVAKIDQKRRELENEISGTFSLRRE